jgi:hypothetical protein
LPHSLRNLLSVESHARLPLNPVQRQWSPAWSQGANPGNLSGRNHARSIGGGNAHTAVPHGASEGGASFRTHTSKPGLVTPTNPLVVVVVKQTHHQRTVTLPPLHLQRVSVLKYQLVLQRWAHNIKMCQRFLENNKTKRWTVFLREWAKTGFHCCARVGTVLKSLRTRHANICRLFGLLAGQAKKPVSVLQPKSIAETASTLLDLDTSHTKLNRLRKMAPGLLKAPAQVSKFS